MLSVVIPFRDQIGMLNRCLSTLVESIDTKDLQDLELVLVNNQSKDGFEKDLTIPDGLNSKVVNANYEFNFQRVINDGVSQSKGDTLLLLNNDVYFHSGSKGWFRYFVEKSSRPNVGAVGALLLYPDQTIQHAGVVVGMDQYAEHLYRTWTMEDAADYSFHAPTENRYVSAVTAAFIVVERSKFEKVRGFDENFIVCGGDVDFCLRLEEAGYKNLYIGEYSFIHEESKSRDASKIPEKDFIESRRSYDAFLNRHNGRDPYYAAHLPLTHKRLVDLDTRHPSTTLKSRLKTKARDILLRTELESFEEIVAKKVAKIRRRFIKGNLSNRLLKRPVESRFLPYMMKPCSFHKIHPENSSKRLNIILPHFQEAGVFAGITTAIIVGLKLIKSQGDINLRLVFVDAGGSREAVLKKMGSLWDDSESLNAIEVVEVYDREKHSLPVHDNDFFMATAWWTCYQADSFSQGKPFFYLIQDYEPGFYPWGDEYAYSLATYKMNIIPIFNTKLLFDYFKNHRYITDELMEKASFFQPAVDLSFFRRPRASRQGDKKRLLFYARPGVARNLFSMGVIVIKQALEKGLIDPSRWEIVSAGQYHDPIDLSDSLTLKSIGKVSLEEYAELLSRTDLGLSLMLSPHPSYPPLEMSAAGVICVTNRFENKDLASFSDNIVSTDLTINDLVEGLTTAVKKLEEKNTVSEDRIDYPDNWDDALLEVSRKLVADMQQLS